MHVIGAVATDGLQHQDGLDHLGFAEAAAALAQLQMVRDQIREAKGAEYAGGGKSAGVRAGGFPEGSGIELEGGFGHERETRETSRHSKQRIDGL